MKKNNKGFSLVELIVVVLIMGILAVALTPQVIKWVQNSRIASDKNNYDALYASVQLALADESVYSAVYDKANKDDAYGTFTIGTASTVYSNGDSDTLGAKMLIVSPDYKSITKKNTSHADYVITVYKSGTLAKTTQPDDVSSMDTD